MTTEQLIAPGKARPYAEARALAALLVQESPALHLTELGKMLKRDIAPLGRAGRRILEEATMDQRLKDRIEVLRSELSEWQKV